MTSAHEVGRADQALVGAIEQFLYAEASLVDAWRLDEWLTLFTDDARYEVPSTDRPSGVPDDSLMLIADDMSRLRARVERLNSRAAHREFPWSRTRHVVTNVQVLAAESDEITVAANFVVYRVRSTVVSYVGGYLYRLAPAGDGFRIRYRRAELDLVDLDAQGTLSIIV